MLPFYLLKIKYSKYLVLPDSKKSEILTYIAAFNSMLLVVTLNPILQVPSKADQHLKIFHGLSLYF
ncbi:hypothetical protein LV84_03234 [Algoriphagus ratkowskyi]|uniref:Uncharacterized protein n=1 Tax=Algoriphagus ratkowskyi TaxID=57028 RepID=A0A2W7R5D3_9BACT|nr:hypothetical protein LV84_03234 [Algoriphagus ratkowskyi]